jgi:hypothetical protein
MTELGPPLKKGQIQKTSPTAFKHRTCTKWVNSVNKSVEFGMTSGLSPGWPDLVGMEHELAMQQIHYDVMGLTIMYGPKGFFRIGDVSLSRVWLDINPDGTVAYVPSIG